MSRELPSIGYMFFQCALENRRSGLAQPPYFLNKLVCNLHLAQLKKAIARFDINNYRWRNRWKSKSRLSQKKMF